MSSSTLPLLLHAKHTIRDSHFNTVNEAKSTDCKANALTIFHHRVGSYKELVAYAEICHEVLYFSDQEC